MCGGQRQQAKKTSLFVAIYCSIGPVFSSLVHQLETIKYLSSNMKHGKPKYPVPCDIYCRFVHDELWQPCVPQPAWFLLLEFSHQCWKTSQLTHSALTREPRKQGPIPETIRSLWKSDRIPNFSSAHDFSIRSDSTNDPASIGSWSWAILLATWIGVGSEISSQQLIILLVISP